MTRIALGLAEYSCFAIEDVTNSFNHPLSTEYAMFYDMSQNASWLQETNLVDDKDIQVLKEENKNIRLLLLALFNEIGLEGVE